MRYVYYYCRFCKSRLRGSEVKWALDWALSFNPHHLCKEVPYIATPSQQREITSQGGLLVVVHRVYIDDIIPDYSNPRPSPRPKASLPPLSPP